MGIILGDIHMYEWKVVNALNNYDPIETNPQRLWNT